MALTCGWLAELTRINMDKILNPIVMTGSGTVPFYPVSIPYSCRFDSARSCKLTKTPAGAGNRKTWTYSVWVKRSKLSTPQGILDCFSSSGNWVQIDYDATTNGINVQGYTSSVKKLECFTVNAFRDPAQWMHLVFTLDTTQATAANRFKMYINGVQATFSGTPVYPNQNDDLWMNAAIIHGIGLVDVPGSSQFSDYYLADAYFIDGAALDATTFGQFSTINPNVWIPKIPTGLTYGTNGFHMDFADSSVLGNDVSGNNNDYTSSGLTSADQMADTPTNNYPTFSPVSDYTDVTNKGTFSNGNLTYVGLTTGVAQALLYSWGSPSLWQGKFYFETKINGAGVHYLGMYDTCYDNVNGVIYKNGVSSQTGLATATTNDIIGCAFDTVNGTLTFYKNNVQLGAQLTGVDFTRVGCNPGVGRGTGVAVNVTFNFGANGFTYTPPTGFKALCTANLPDPAIIDSSKGFDAKLYTGTGAAQNITSFNFQPDLVWNKSRTTATGHLLIDSVRGAYPQLSSNSTAAEVSDSFSLTSFLSNGFSLGTDGNSRGINLNSIPYVSWCWKKAATFGFDIVGYTGNGSSQSVNHLLGTVPQMVIVKGRSGAGRNWMVQFGYANADRYLMLNSAAAYTIDSTLWNATNPTSTTFTVGPNANTNQSSETFIAYLFRSVPGFSMFGSYTGNGSADGPFVYCGFRPRYILIKCATAAYTWIVYDAARNTYNVVDKYLYPAASDVEATLADSIDITANGFKLRTTNVTINAAQTYVFAAFAEAPFKYANAR